MESWVGVKFDSFFDVVFSLEIIRMASLALVSGNFTRFDCGNSVRYENVWVTKCQTLEILILHF